VKRDIYARLDALTPAVWDGPVYRHTARTIESSRILNGEGARHNGGRWNPQDSFRTVYLSLDVPTVVAEFRRTIGPGRDISGVAKGYVVWRVNAKVDNLVDLRPVENRRALDLPEPFVGSPRELSQDIGDAAYYVRYKGLLVPSAAVDGGINLVVFPDHLEAGDVLEVDPSPPHAMSDLLA
jgi:RES domain-containing protein